MKFTAKIKTKAKEVGVGVKEKVKKTTSWFLDYLDKNPDTMKVVVYGGIATVGGIVTGLANYTSGIVPTKDSCMVEDDVTGQHFRTKHPLNNNEILELGDRMIDGQTKGEALVDMGLLKKERRRR